MSSRLKDVLILKVQSLNWDFQRTCADKLPHKHTNGLHPHPVQQLLRRPSCCATEKQEDDTLIITEDKRKQTEMTSYSLLIKLYFFKFLFNFAVIAMRGVGLKLMLLCFSTSFFKDAILVWRKLYQQRESLTIIRSISLWKCWMCTV